MAEQRKIKLEDFEDDFDAVEALLKQADIEPDKKKLKEPDTKADIPKDDKAADDEEDESPEEDDEDTGDEPSEDDESEEDETEEAPKKVVIDPEADAYVTINGKEVKVSELTSVFAKDSELTARAAEVAEVKRTTEEKATRYVAGLEGMLERAIARAEPYAKINFLALSKDPNISAEEITALSNEAQKAFADVEYFKTTLDTTVGDIHKARHEELVKQGQEAWKVLSDPEKGIKDWSEDKYKEVSSFAVAQGIDKRVIDTLVDPSAIKLLHMAMLYHKGQTATSTAKKVDKTPKKILKGVPEAVTQKAKPNKVNKAFEKLQNSGSVDDAMEALLARMVD